MPPIYHAETQSLLYQFEHLSDRLKEDVAYARRYHASTSVVRELRALRRKVNRWIERLWTDDYPSLDRGWSRLASYKSSSKRLMQEMRYDGMYWLRE